MSIHLGQIALNPLQYMATADGWLNPGQRPSLSDQLAYIGSQGFRAVQTDIGPDLTPEQYRSELDAAGFVAGPGYIGLIVDDDDTVKTSLENAQRVAGRNAAVGSSLSFLAMGMSKEAPRVAKTAALGIDFDEARFERVIDLVGKAAELVRAEGVTPAFHPHVGTWVETEPETRRVLDAIPADLLAFGPDTGHLTWAGADTVGLLRDYSERIAGVHIKDLFMSAVERGRAERMSYQESVLQPLWTEPGTGDVDFDALYDALPDNFDGWTVIEVDRGNQPTAEESIALCGQWVAKVTA